MAISAGSPPCWLVLTGQAAVALDLSRLRLLSLTCLDWALFARVTTLNLANNRIAVVDPLAAMASLQRLDLQNNRIE